MEDFRVGPEAFSKAFAARADALVRMASDMSSAPSVEEVHDLRVSVRRVQAMCKLLPRRTRQSQRCREFRSCLCSFMAASSGLRDLDILLSTLRDLGGAIPVRTLDSLLAERAAAATRTWAVAAVLTGASPPVVDSRNLKASRIRRRLKRSVGDREGKVEGLLKTVLNKETKAKELHALRVEMKKLRYLLEVAGSHGKRSEALASWQEALGAIHDIDVAVSYVQASLPPTAAKKAVRLLRQKRHEKYLFLAGRKELPRLGGAVRPG